MHFSDWLGIRGVYKGWSGWNRGHSGSRLGVEVELGAFLRIGDLFAGILVKVNKRLEKSYTK